MKALRGVIFTLAFACLVSPACGDVSIIINHGTFVSPDGRFILSFAPETNSYGSELPELTIKDLIIGAVEHCDPNAREGDGLNVLTPVFFIKWTGDSKSILVISHIAHGTIAAVLHFDGKAWHQNLLQPPSPDEGHFTVLSQHVGLHDIGITYAVDVPLTSEPSDTPQKFYRSGFVVNPTTSRYSQVHNQKLEYSAYSEKEFD